MAEWEPVRNGANGEFKSADAARKWKHDMERRGHEAKILLSSHTGKYRVMVREKA